MSFSVKTVSALLLMLLPLALAGQQEQLALAAPEAKEVQQTTAFDRGIENSVFVPKGQWLMGGSFSYGENTADNYELLIIDDIRGTNYSFKVSPYFAYFLKDNLCVGARFGYTRSMIKLNSTSINISEDLNFDIENFYNLRHVYSGSLFMRNYISFGKSKTFAFFNEVRLTAGGGQGKHISGTGDALTGSYQDILELELGIIPGLTIFIANNVAVEASVNVLGFSYKKYSQTRDRIYEGSFEHSGVDFKVDIFSINIGVSFYFDKLNLMGPFKKKKKI